MTEFELIKRYFSRPAPSALIGNGDDCAVVAPRAGHAFAITTDTLIEGRHFLPTLDPYTLGRRAVAVNLSDLAAMGAEPRFATLSLALPDIDESWLNQFSLGLWSALDEHGVELIGGNTTRAALSVSLTALGDVPVVNGQAQTLLRSGAQAGDELWVSGPMGEAGWALYCLLNDPRAGEGASATARQIACYEAPQARVTLGLALRGVATSCIDVSDGLLSEATHIANASDVNIAIEFAAIPHGLSHWLESSAHATFAKHCILTTGDAYELLFTAKPSDHAWVAQTLRRLGLSGAQIGLVGPRQAKKTKSDHDSVTVLGAKSEAMDIAVFGSAGWDHFGGASV